MSLTLNRYAEKLEVPGIRKFSNRISEFPEAVNLTVGQPDFHTPAIVKQTFIDAVNDNYTTYSHNQGLPELRRAVSQFMADKYNACYESDCILITNGASEAIDTVFRTLLEPGDEVILPGPIYAGYIPVIENMGATVVLIDTTVNQCKVTPEMIEAVVTDKTKAIILNYPNNPTGAILSADDTAALAHYLAQQNFYTISDEIYSENTFGQPHVSFGSFPELQEKLLLINGLSKSHAMTGFRIGFCMGPAELMAHITIVHAYNCICANVPAQHAAIAAVTTARDAAAVMNEAYIVRRNYCMERLSAMNMRCIQPDGAFYLFIDIQPFAMTSFDFANRALEQYGVVIVPGSTFTAAGEGYVRLSYAYHQDVLAEGLNRLEAMVNDLTR
ncbi:aminotransferase class I/II-fold pyridoxal phosphate-dependent enzyme [Macrococcus equipercicus]|uniref:Aminotransferase n=1 Tax=Macrococcus equipercicus TaxID=69967 RepID=A0ABQ6RBK0_9STAP|nr:aminotransferase class I/II-fold pyridoxal phosphate-dependent enzyme [Macrococcus equipercicus]KAA1042620.1 aminotransferase class I/II-fold pyridoxal phosphate-dependent enzyme [Macrococcus equipercicus]